MSAPSFSFSEVLVEPSLTKREAERQRREAAEPAEKPCRECGESKPAEAFKRIPVGGRAHVCNQCLSARKTEAERRVEDGDTVILEELWKQYDEAMNTGEKIRCLEALVKLRPSKESGTSALDAPSVVAGLIKAMKAKKRDAKPNGVE